MKNVLYLLMALALVGSASAAPEDYAPNTWGFAATGAGNPYTFDGPCDSLLTDQDPDVWGTWGDGGGGGDVTVCDGLCTIVSNVWELAFSHDNALVDIGNPVPGVDGIEVVLTVESVTGDGYISMKIECYDETDVFANNDDGGGAVGIADFEAVGGDYLITASGVYSFSTADIDFEVPAGTLAVTPVITVAGGATTAVIDEIWLGKAGTYSTTKATNPNPKDGAAVPTTPKPVLSWTNPDPNNPLVDTITSDVFFLIAGTEPLTEDPNMSEDLKDPGVIQIANNTTDESVDLPVYITLEEDHYYYWAVNCTDPGVIDPNTGEPVETLGDIWMFNTGDSPPDPNAGLDQFNWVSKEDGDGNPNVYTITITGTYTDDAKSAITDANFVNLNWGWDPDNGELGIEKISQIWTHNGTGGTNVPPDIVEHTAGTVTAVFKTHYVEGDPDNSTAIPGYWDLQLQVTDGTGTAQDVAYVRVDEDCAAAADADASDTFDTTYDAAGNRNCKNDLPDFAAFAAAWLDESVKFE